MKNAKMLITLILMLSYVFVNAQPKKKSKKSPPKVVVPTIKIEAAKPILEAENPPLIYDVAMPAFPELSSNTLLSLDAFTVLKANKYLDFKNRDTLVEVIDNVIYEKIALPNYFGYEKKWHEIEKEDTATYRKQDDKYSYTYNDSTMVEEHTYHGGYNVRREITVTYNVKGFELRKREKVFVGDNYIETHITTSMFNNKHKVTAIINKTERNNSAENRESIINAIYNNDSIIVSSKNGTIICKFITDANSIGYVSTLNPRDVADYFSYAIGHQMLDEAREYCTSKMSQELKKYFTIPVSNINFISWSGKFSTDKVNIKDVWEIKYTDGNTKIYNVEMVLVKLPKGWKIDYARMSE
jgi:hypothetical protein